MAQSNDRMNAELNRQNPEAPKAAAEPAGILNDQLYDIDNSEPDSPDAFTGLSEEGDNTHPGAASNPSEEHDPELAEALRLSMQQAPAASDTPQAPAANQAVDTPKPAEAPKAEAPKREAPKAEAPKAEAPKAEAPKAEAAKAFDNKQKEEKRKSEQFKLTAEDIEVLRDIPRVHLRFWWKTEAGYSEFHNALLEYSSVKAASIIVEDIVGDPKFKSKMQELKSNMERDHKIFTHIQRLIQASKQSNVSIETIIEQLPAPRAKETKDFEGKIQFWLKFYKKEVTEQLGASAAAKPQAGAKQSGKPGQGKPGEGANVPPLNLGGLGFGLGDDPDLAHDKPKPGDKKPKGQGFGQGFGAFGNDWDLEQALQNSLLSEKLGGGSHNPDADFEQAIAASLGQPLPGAKPQHMGSAEFKADAEAAKLETKRRSDKPQSGAATADAGSVKPQAQKSQAQAQKGPQAGQNGAKPAVNPAANIVPLTLEEQIKNQAEKVARLEKALNAEEAMVENQFAAFQAVKAENEKGLKESFAQYEARNALMRKKLEKAGMDEKILKEIEAGTILESIASFSDKKQELIQSHIEAVFQYQQFVEEYNLAKQQAELELKPKMEKLEKDFVQKRLEIDRAKIELREAKERLKYLEGRKKQEDAEAALIAKIGSQSKPEAPKAEASKPAEADKPAQAEPVKTQEGDKPAQAELSKAQGPAAPDAQKPAATQAQAPGAANNDNAKPATTAAASELTPVAVIQPSGMRAVGAISIPQRSYPQADFGPVNISELHRKERDEQQERMRAQQRQQQERAREERERAAAAMDQKQQAETEQRQRAEQDAKARREAGVTRLEQLARTGSSNTGFNSLTAYTSYSNLGSAPAAAAAGNGNSAPAQVQQAQVQAPAEAPQAVVAARPAEAQVPEVVVVVRSSENSGADSRPATTQTQKP